MNNRYVYIHKHPETSEIFYVGLGSNDRAWAITSKARHPDHREYLLDLISEGHVASDWTTVVARNLASGAAYALERELIVKYSPFFNRDKEQFQMSAELKAKAVEMFSAGKKWIEISRELGFHYTTIKYHVKKQLEHHQ